MIAEISLYMTSDSSQMPRNLREPLLIIAFTVVGLWVVFLPVVNIGITILFGLGFTVVLPGYSLIAAIFPEGDLDGADRLVLSLGASLALTALAGIFLDWTPWGITAQSWATLLGMIILGSTVARLLRRKKRQTGKAKRSGLTLSKAQLGLILSAVAIAIASLWLSRVAALNQPYPGFTQLWLLPAQQGTVRLGVKNMESETTNYNLQLEIRGNVIHEWGSIELLPGQEWDVTFKLPPEAEVYPTEAYLYRSGQSTTPYRSVVLWPGV